MKISINPEIKLESGASYVLIPLEAGGLDTDKLPKFYPEDAQVSLLADAFNLRGVFEEESLAGCVLRWYGVFNFKGVGWGLVQCPFIRGGGFERTPPENWLIQHVGFFRMFRKGKDLIEWMSKNSGFDVSDVVGDLALELNLPMT